ESAIRLAVSLGGDSDTIACMTGGMAEAYYGGVPEGIQEQVFRKLDDRQKGIVKEFLALYK
ncbi:MAG TPA: ADP-ribosylglycohydrolase family protein, partial [Syntrophorhabdaceae bacterium]|nr:ADP-ribosylglycohydrolase family protein [Syntrophorhabdaceae bacterium]